MNRITSLAIQGSNWCRLAWNYLRKNSRPPQGPPPDAADVSYGPHRQQKLDFWHPVSPTSDPAPVLIFFHGGGFVRGRKYHSRLLREARELGAATVSANYRLTRPRGITVEDSMQDAASAILLVLNHAKEWGIDPNRIALAGNSAGGCLALWCAFTEAACPVRCVVTYNSLTTIDPNILVNEIGGPGLSHYRPLWAALFDAKGLDALHSPQVSNIINTYSPLARFHPGVPPAYIEFNEDPPAGGGRHAATASLMKILHSPRYGFLLKKLYEGIGQKFVLSYPSEPAAISSLDFVKLHLLEIDLEEDSESGEKIPPESDTTGFPPCDPRPPIQE